MKAFHGWVYDMHGGVYDMHGLDHEGMVEMDDEVMAESVALGVVRTQSIDMHGGVYDIGPSQSICMGVYMISDPVNR